MTTKDRLLEYIQYKGITQRAFCRKAGLSENLLSSKSGEFFDSTIEKIRESYPDLNIDWVRTGEGEMLNNAIYIDRIDRLLSIIEEKDRQINRLLAIIENK